MLLKNWNERKRKGFVFKKDERSKELWGTKS